MEKYAIIKNKVKWRGGLRESFLEAMGDLPEIEGMDFCSLNDTANSIINYIKSKAKSVGMITKINAKTGQSKPWFDAECVALKDSLKILLKKCRELNFEINITQYTAIQKNFTKI